MKALIYEGPKEMNMREVPVPSPNRGEIVIRVEYSGICGSELSGYLGQNSLRIPPLIMGHEFSGTIASLGDGVSRFKRGDRVTANPLVSCGQCDECVSGHPQLCASRQLLGAHLPGSFAEYVAVAEKNVYTLPNSLSLESAAMAEPFACGIHACRLLQLDPSDRLLIVGAGPIGLFTMLAAQLFGLEQIVVMDINKERLQIVRELGGIPVPGPEELAAVRPSKGFDAALDAVGHGSTRQTCLHALRSGGRMAFSGLHSADSELPVNHIIRNEIRIVGAFAYTPRDFESALQWLADGKANLLPWTEIRPLSEGKVCFEKLLNSPGKHAKILLRI